MWMGGHAPLGYVVHDRKLVIDETEGALVRHIFERFLQVGSATRLVQELNAAGHRTKRGKPFDKGVLYKLLNNRTYDGEVEHKGVAYPGQHDALVDPATGTRCTLSSPRTDIAAPAARAPRPPRCSRA
jgi:hypothetical protein